MLTGNELMIGDYLYWGKDKVVKVQMIRKYGDNFGIDAIYNDSVNLYFCTDNDDIYSYNIDELKPIPLTPDILEKNGFTKELENGSHYRFTLIDEHIKISILYARSVFQWLGPLDFKYVHELQHALRLCGIKKEIEI
jgi:hypothetical protein